MEDSQVSAECHRDWHKIKHAAKESVHKQSQAGESFMYKNIINSSKCNIRLKSDTSHIFPSLNTLFLNKSRLISFGLKT